jgi:hypothetical protein
MSSYVQKIVQKLSIAGGYIFTYTQNCWHKKIGVILCSFCTRLTLQLLHSKILIFSSVNNHFFTLSTPPIKTTKLNKLIGVL